uniref:DLEC1 cilia and flagella associated protein n=1 Tax=Hippocampus comes TaxID=109280 RepID=A0A3Q2XGJ9_HIPCM
MTALLTSLGRLEEPVIEAKLPPTPSLAHSAPPLPSDLKSDALPTELRLLRDREEGGSARRGGPGIATHREVCRSLGPLSSRAPAAPSPPTGSFSLLTPSKTSRDKSDRAAYGHGFLDRGGVRERRLSATCGRAHALIDALLMCFAQKDISHVLASTFKELYTKVTPCNLMKAKGRSSYHDKYVDELKRVRAEYNQRIKEADMLESHIIQARARAASTERRTTERMKEDFRDVPDLQGLPPGRRNIHPLLASFQLSTAREPRRDRSVFPEKMQSRPRPKWKDEPSATDRAEGNEKLRKMKERQRMLQNPRFLPPKAHRGAASLIRPRTAKKDGGEPPALERSALADVSLPSQSTLELKNVSFSSRDIRVLPPSSSHFTIGLGRFPGKGGVVAPGMSCKFTVRFAPDSLADYEDRVVVESEGEHILVVPIEARRPPPVLTLPGVLDCGYCLIGGLRCVQFHCQNVGLSAGTFCVVPKDRWPSVATSCYCEQPPFAVSPSFFALQPGESTVVEALFFPATTEQICRIFTVVCDNCQVKDVCVQGEGQLIALELLSVSGEERPPVLGEARDVTADHFVRFEPCNPRTAQRKTAVIRNNVHLELPFRWRIMKPNLPPPLLAEIPEPRQIRYQPEWDDVFQVSPASGILAPCRDRDFTISFCPKEVETRSASHSPALCARASRFSEPDTP